MIMKSFYIKRGDPVPSDTVGGVRSLEVILVTPLKLCSHYQIALNSVHTYGTVISARVL